MVLETAKKFVKMGQDAARSLPPRVIPQGHINDADLWIMMHGFAGAFTSIANTIKDVDIQNDKVLQEAFGEWKKENWDEFNRLANKLRRLMVHRGESFTTHPRTDLVEDDWHDTWFPQYGHVFMYREDKFGKTEEVDFGQWVVEIYDWWDKQIRQIEMLYRLKKSSVG